MTKGHETELFQSAFNKIFDGLHEVRNNLKGWEFVYDDNDQKEVIYIKLLCDNGNTKYERLVNVNMDSVSAAIYDVVIDWEAFV